MNVRLIVVTHKKYDMPADDMYLPVCVGGSRDALRSIYQCDDTGDNISDKNGTYCELTGIYWAWKNLPAQYDYVGVCHYRRYFANAKGNGPASRMEIERNLRKNDVIVTKPHVYPLYTVESHYCKSMRGMYDMHKNDFAMLRRAVGEVSPEYIHPLEKVLAGNSAHMLNMFVMKRKMFDEYCKWMFSIVDRTVELLDNRPDKRRYAGALSEMLLDAWLIKNGIKYTEMGVYETEKKNFFARLFSFVKRKISG